MEKNTEPKTEHDGEASECLFLLCVDGKAPKMLWPAIRQYQHNDCSGFVIGFDYNEVLKVISGAIMDAHMAGQADAGVDPGFSNAQAYLRELGDA